MDNSIEDKQFEIQPLDYSELDERSIGITQILRQQQIENDETFIKKLFDAKPEIEKCLRNNEIDQQKLIDDGLELLTNVKISNENREYLMRINNKKRLQDYYDFFNLKTMKCDIQLKSIMDKWSAIKEIHEPIEFNERLSDQKAEIMRVAEMKNEIIDKYCVEIQHLHKSYTDMSSKQKADISELCKRIIDQLNNIRLAYREKVDSLEETIETEWIKFHVNASNVWTGKFNELSNDFEQKEKLYTKRKEFFSTEFKRIKLDHGEATRAMRLRLAKEKENLEFDLRQYKLKILLDSEKLLYNYYILRRQNDENVLILSEERRDLAKLEAKVASVERELDEHEMSFQGKVHGLNEVILSAIKGIQLSQRNMASLADGNHKKYTNVWKMYESEITGIFNEISEIEAYLNEIFLHKPSVSSRSPLATRNFDLDEFVQRFDHDLQLGPRAANVFLDPKDINRANVSIYQIGTSSSTRTHNSAPETSIDATTHQNMSFDNPSTHSNHSQLRSLQEARDSNVSDVRKYWSRFVEMFNSSEHKMLWHGFELGITKYLSILKKRESLVNKCTQLRRQNYELSHCLQNYLSE